MSSINRTIHIALHALGILSLASVATKSSHMLWRYFLKPSNNIKKLYKKDGKEIKRVRSGIFKIQEE
jgi:hypothetical protein